ncbi:Ubiquinone/menaquinone biosynthesis C-methyltransferase UbiE [Ophiocordyceps camponoti-floridani]|uniref:Ubiquinone/menaquinone biosynthesis C-methyltransferase UbiE n=1 Tax=Ophiocordyceps camponoti-floridani TaxID=2030778 RepID=A0A8H4Q714_9HYPO|nr:Ubiquinone/menaquinone biosynthesis C-methyltransferase UbiE [Ophiocordyceps camponoti-floridani]
MCSVRESQYDHIGQDYSDYANVTIPFAKLAAELVGEALGDCTGLTVLDLAGGDGLHARRALDAGAAYVDVVDVSEKMIELGKAKDQGADREGRLRWFVANVMKPLREQGSLSPEDGRYDIVMGNWLHESAALSEKDAELMWRNIVDSLKPGGRFLGLRMLYSGATGRSLKGKYGATVEDIKEVPGVWLYRLRMETKKPFTLEATMVPDVCLMKNKIPRDMGLVDFDFVPMEKLAMVQSDMEFWREAREDPMIAVVTAKKPEAKV